VADFAILVQNGCSARQAIGLQFCTAAFAFAGTAVGLLTQSDAAANGQLLAAVSGGFVYLATMTVLPELLLASDDRSDGDQDEARSERPSSDGDGPAANAHAMATRSARKRPGKGAATTPAKLAPPQEPTWGVPWLSPRTTAALAQTAAEAAAFSVGVYMMVLVAKLEMHDH
jgi:hypothetical protein